MSKRSRLAVMSLLSVLILWLAASFSPVSSQAEPSSPLNCREAQGPFPKFAGMGGVWTASGNDLLLLDTFDRVILRYDGVGGQKSRPILTSLAQHLQDGHPRSIATNDGKNFYVQVDANRFAAVDDRYSYQSVVAKKSKGGEIVRKVYIYGISKQGVLAFADVENTATDGWHQGFIYFPADAPESFKWLVRDVSFEEKMWYQLSMPFIAGLGDAFYVLKMSSPYALYRFDPKAENDFKKLSALDPAGSSRANNILPQLRDLQGSSDVASIMESIEHAEALPVGMYGYGDRLYILFRTWKGNHTEWSLKVVDPQTDKLLGTVKLAVNADSLSLVPGPSSWALIRKALPDGIHRQDVTGISLFNGRPLLNKANLPLQICGR